MYPPFFRRAALTFAIAAFGPQSAMALTLPFNGNFTHDNDIQFFTFTLGSASHIDINTSSFGTVVSGGFVPWLRVWDAAGNGQGSPAQAIPDSGNAQFSFDSIAGGSYIGAVFAWHNYPPQDFATAFDPAEFWHSGAVDTNPGYLAEESGCPSTPGNFVFDLGFGCSNRTGNWAFTIVGPDLTSASLYPDTSGVPEPASLALVLAGLAGFAPFARRRPG